MMWLTLTAQTLLDPTCQKDTAPGQSLGSAAWAQTGSRSPLVRSVLGPGSGTNNQRWTETLHSLTSNTNTHM